MTVAHQSQTTRANHQKWLYLYLLLAVFVVGLLGIGVLINHRLILAHRHSIAVNIEWVTRLVTADELAHQASAIVKPANDVFKSRDAAAEAERLSSAHALFDKTIVAQIQELRVHLNTGERQLLTRDCTEVETQMEHVVEVANLVIAAARDGDSARAGEWLTALNKEYDDVLVALNQLRAHYREHRAAFMDAQQAEVASVGRLELLMASLALAAVACFVFYGVRLNRQMLASEAKYRVLIETTQTGYLILDSEGKVVDANQEYVRLTGHREFREIQGRSVIEWTAEYEKERNAMAVAKCARDGFIRDLVIDYIDGTGQITPVEINATVVSNVEGISIISLCRDITKRKQTEDAVQAKSKELEQFTYAVSHDLRSPLVTIQTFLGYLEQDIPAQDTAKVASDLGYIHAAADKMGLLLDELLRLSRVGRVPNLPEDVPLSVIVNETLALVAGRISQRGVKVVVTEKNIMLHGDRRRLVEVFQNLIDNACKFMGDQKEPRIEIGVETRGPETVYFVRDNGGGIDPRHQKMLFGLFVRLTPHVEGAGIGLALVKRIVEVHGGRIWVKSKGVGQGTCFYFTLAGKGSREGEVSRQNTEYSREE